MNASRFFILSALLPLLFSCGSAPGIKREDVKRFQSEPLVKVAIVKGKDSVRISGRGLALSIGRRKVVYRQGSVTVKVYPGGFEVEGVLYGSDDMSFDGDDILVEGSPLWGRVSLLRVG